MKNTPHSSSLKVCLYGIDGCPWIHVHTTAYVGGIHEIMRYEEGKAAFIDGRQPFDLG